MVRRFIAKWFQQAAEIEKLRNDLDFSNRRCDQIEGLLERAETERDLLIKDLKSERRAKDKILLRYADQVSKQAKLPTHFVTDAIETPAPVVEPPNAYADAQDDWAARELRQQDLDNCANDVEKSRIPDLEHYKAKIQENRDAVYL